jgi:hypothetical protein
MTCRDDVPGVGEKKAALRTRTYNIQPAEPRIARTKHMYTSCPCTPVVHGHPCVRSLSPHVGYRRFARLL